MTKIAIATINTADDEGRMTIYYNGAHELMTAVNGDYVEPLSAVAAPLCLDMAEDMVGKMYADPIWDLQRIEREPEPAARCWNCWAGRTDVCECFPESCNQYEPIFDGHGRTLTNADRIRAMTDERLAKVLCDYNTRCPPRICPGEDDCIDCWIEWLRQEVTNDK